MSWFPLAALMVFGVFAVSAAVVGVFLRMSDKTEFDRNRLRASSFWQILRGDTRTMHDGIRDHRVQAGLVKDLRTGEFVEQGRLSEEAIDAVLHSR